MNAVMVVLMSMLIYADYVITELQHVLDTSITNLEKTCLMHSNRMPWVLGSFSNCATMMVY